MYNAKTDLILCRYGFYGTPAHSKIPVVGFTTGRVLALRFCAAIHVEYQPTFAHSKHVRRVYIVIQVNSGSQQGIRQVQ